jgi:hypothetical protein
MTLNWQESPAGESITWSRRFFCYYIPASSSISGGGILAKAYRLWLGERSIQGDEKATKKLSLPLSRIEPDNQWKQAAIDGNWEQRAKSYHAYYFKIVLEDQWDGVGDYVATQIKTAKLSNQIINSLLEKFHEKFCSTSYQIENTSDIKNLSSSISMLINTQKVGLEYLMDWMGADRINNTLKEEISNRN